MTTFDGETPSGVSDALAEAADPATVIADETAESLEQPTAERWLTQVTRSPPTN